MNSVNSIGHNLATDGHSKNNSNAQNLSRPKVTPVRAPMADAEQVVQKLTKNIAQDKVDAEQIQKVSDIVTGEKMRFRLNPELGQVVVSIVDPQTNQVIKEIPSVDQQKIRMKIKKTTGLIFDALV